MPWLHEYGPEPKRLKLVQADGKDTTVPSANWGLENTAKQEAADYCKRINAGEISANSIGWSYPSNKSFHRRPIAFTVRPPMLGSWMLIPDPDPETNEFGEVAP